MKFIHAQFQSTIIAFGVSISLFSLAIVYASHELFISKSLAALKEANVPSESPIYFFVSQQKELLGGAFLIALAGGVVAALLIGYLLSVRVARPLKQMQTHFDSVARGSVPTRFHFRKSDYFQEVADAYNLQLEKLGLFPKIKKDQSEIVFK